MLVSPHTWITDGIIGYLEAKYPSYEGIIDIQYNLLFHHMTIPDNNMAS